MFKHNDHDKVLWCIQVDAPEPHPYHGEWVCLGDPPIPASRERDCIPEPVIDYAEFVARTHTVQHADIRCGVLHPVDRSTDPRNEGGSAMFAIYAEWGVR